MNTISKKWIEAARALIQDKTAKVICPECMNGILIIKDEEIKEWDKIDRYLICNNCGKWNVITMSKGSADIKSDK